MPTGRFKLKYDEEYDNIFVYDMVKRAAYGVELGPLDISYDQRGNLVSLSFNDASEFLTNLTSRKITKAVLAKVNDCRLNIVEKAGILYIKFSLRFKEKQLQPIEDTLTVKALNFKSPVSACA
jgi:hypothetical protein